MHLYFVRHGESEANILMEFSNSDVKHSLTAKGLAQAQNLASNLAGLKFSRIYTSPVLRAAQTAQILAEKLSSPIVYTEALREWSVGSFEGTRDPAGWALHRKVQEDWYWRKQLDSKMPGGESFLEIKARFVPFIQTLRLQDDGADENILLVGHGGLYLAMLPVILQNIDHEFALQRLVPYTGEVVAENQPDGLWCQSWCGFRV